MKYLKLYEDFNTYNFKIKDLLEDISSLDYILSDEGIKVKYYVSEKTASHSVNTYMIGTSDDISTKADESFDGVGIYKIKVYFDTKPEMKEILFEYYNQLKEHLEEVYDVDVVKDKPYTQVNGYIWTRGHDGTINSEPSEIIVKNCVSIIIERQPDDYIYFEDEDNNDINESVDDETSMKHYGLYPEDVKEMFYDLQDLDIFPETLRVFVEFKSLLKHDEVTDGKFTFKHQPFIEVRIKSDGIKIPTYGLTQADRRRRHEYLDSLMNDERFKEVIEIAGDRLEDYDWKIQSIENNIANDYIKIIIIKN